MHLRSFLAVATLAAAAAVPAHAVPVIYTGTLTGAVESPPVSTTGIGAAIVTIDVAVQTMDVQVSFAALLAGNTAAHIHCCTAAPDAGNAGVATTVPTFTGFPTGATSGTYDHAFDMSDAASYNPAFLAAHGSVADSFAFLVAGLNAGEAYLNIHSSLFPGGEIRAFLHTVAVIPEPQTYALMLVGAALVGWVGRRRQLR